MTSDYDDARGHRRHLGKGRMPAAMYVQTDAQAQDGSTDSQAATIRQWASHNGYEVIESFCDEVSAGPPPQTFPGLDRLFRAVVSGTPGFRTILAYNPWVWRGPCSIERDQHEWLFAKLGFAVCYCAPEYLERAACCARVIETVKRAMAGDFSRHAKGRRQRSKSKENS